MLTILKYVGLVLAALSTIWGMSLQTTIMENGRKRLTKAGYCAISLTMLGLSIGIGINILQDRQAARAHEDAMRADLRRTNRIIMSDQALTSLRLRWEFHGIPYPLQKHLADARSKAVRGRIQLHGEAAAAQRKDVAWQFELYPFLSELMHALDGTPAHNWQIVPSVLVLFPLDDSQNTILSFGRVNLSETWLADKSRALMSHQDGVLPAGVSTCAAAACDFSQAGTDIVRPYRTWPYLEFPGEPSVIRLKDLPLRPTDDVVLGWDLDPLTLAGALSRQNASVTPTAKLPSVLRLTVLYDFSRIPFDSGNFALQMPSTFWDYRLAAELTHDDPAKDGKRHLATGARRLSSMITLTVNDLPDVIYTYELHRIYSGRLLDDRREVLIGDGCLVFEFRLVRDPW